MKIKILAIIISSVIVVATGVTLLIVYLPNKSPSNHIFDWQPPSNSTHFSNYVKVPYLVSMRDGVRLATDVYVAKNITESLPVILIRTPYGREMVEVFSFYTQLGYIIVIQDFRGFYGSEGEIDLPFFAEKNDGHDTLKWIEKQPWCNGNIGTWGPSALGVAQYLMAPNASSSLKCQLPIVATPDAYEAMFRGGEFRHELIIPWMEENGFLEESIVFISEKEKLDDFWDVGRIVNNYNQINAASIHFGGWYDIFTQGTIDAYMGYQYSGGEGAKGNAKLIMGPWIHEGMFLRVPTGEYMFPNHDLGILLSATDALFEKWLKGNSTLWNFYPNVVFYLMSSLEYNPTQLGNNWFQSNVWPINSEISELFLDSSTSSLENNENYMVFNEISWEWDPQNRTETIGGGNLALPAGMYNQNPVEGRDDVILFTSQVLTESITVVGQINATIFISSNCTDTDFTVKLTDVYPDNRSMLVTDTIIRARNRNGFSDWDFMEPGVIYEISIPLDSTAYLFPPGHRIRIAISSSNYPRFEVNPNTGDPLWQNTTTYVANNTLYTNTTFPSRISLPTVDYDSLIPFSFDFSSMLQKDFSNNKKNLIQEFNVQKSFFKIEMISIDFRREIFI